MSSSSHQNQLPPLIITFEADTCQVAPGETCTFGRSADIEIDAANRLLHRVLGRFYDQQGQWWVANAGRSIPLVVTDVDTASYTRVVAGSAIPLPFRDATISFTAGRANYRLRSHTSALPAPDAPDHRVVDTSEATLTTGALVFNDEQFQLLVALSERRLAGPLTAADLPTNRELAQRLGWTISKFNRKLDNLCTKLARAGVPGLQGSLADVAHDRRLQLANYVVEQGIVLPTDVPGSYS